MLLYSSYVLSRSVAQEKNRQCETSHFIFSGKILSTSLDLNYIFLKFFFFYSFFAHTVFFFLIWFGLVWFGSSVLACRFYFIFIFLFHLSNTLYYWVFSAAAAAVDNAKHMSAFMGWLRILYFCECRSSSIISSVI